MYLQPLRAFWFPFAALVCILEGVVVISARSVRSVPPSNETGAVADTLKCSFDSGLCDLEQDHLQDDFDWTRHVGQTTTFSTGPACDPLNCASGSYMYTESSRPRKNGDTARLSTPLLHGEGPRCLLFFWHMSGSGMGRLSVEQVRPDGARLLLWQRSGHQGKAWQYEKLDIPDPPRFYRLDIEGRVGPSFRSDMAIDNIEVVTGNCDDVVQNDCTFHHDLCSWQNQGPRMWQRNYGNTPTPNTGPLADHNNNPLEYYLYVESSRTLPNDTATLMSGEMAGGQGAPGHCLQFWYHMLGNTVGILRLLTRRVDTGLEEVLWQRSGTAGNGWHRQTLYISSPSHPFRILFQALLIGGGEGDIAIDDISMHAGQCETP